MQRRVAVVYSAVNTTVQFLSVEPYRTCKYVIVPHRISVVNY